MHPTDLDPVLVRRQDRPLLDDDTLADLLDAYAAASRATEEAVTALPDLGKMVPLLTDGVDLVTASPYHPSGAVKNVPGWRLLLSKGSSFLYRRVLRQIQRRVQVSGTPARSRRGCSLAAHWSSRWSSSVA